MWHLRGFFFLFFLATRKKQFTRHLYYFKKIKRKSFLKKSENFKKLEK